MRLSIDKSIQEFLEEFELSEREIVIYLSLLKTGPNTIMNLARETGIKRSTTHNNVEELIKKGLVSQTNYGERRMVVAEEPEKLKFLLDQKKWKMKKMEDNLDNVVDSINKLIPDAKENTEVEVKYYEGKEGINYIYDLLLKNKGGVYSFLNLEKIREAFPQNKGLFLESLDGNKDLEVYDIFEYTEEDRKYIEHERYSYKMMTKGHKLTEFDFLVFGHYVAMIHMKSDKLFAILIESRLIAESLKSIHKLAWELLG